MTLIHHLRDIAAKIWILFGLYSALWWSADGNITVLLLPRKYDTNSPPILCGWIASLAWTRPDPITFESKCNSLRLLPLRQNAPNNLATTSQQTVPFGGKSGWRGGAEGDDSASWKECIHYFLLKHRNVVIAAETFSLHCVHSGLVQKNVWSESSVEFDFSRKFSTPTLRNISDSTSLASSAVLFLSVLIFSPYMCMTSTMWKSTWSSACWRRHVLQCPFKPHVARTEAVRSHIDVLLWSTL